MGVPSPGFTDFPPALTHGQGCEPWAVTVAFGTHEELLATNAVYQEIYENQTRGSDDFDEVGGED